MAKTSRDYLNISFRAGELEPALSARTTWRAPGDAGLSAHQIAQRDLERYYQLLERELPRLDLSQAEVSLVVDALNGTITSEPRHLWAEIADAIGHDRLDQKWGVDGAALVDRLRRLSPAQTIAVIDATERFWERSGAAGRDGEELWQQLRAVGLPWGEDDDDDDDAAEV